MVTIRLMRQGAKKAPQYMIVAVNKRGKRDGGYLEKLGYYFPKAKTKAEKLKINAEAVHSWLKKGAQPSQTVSELIVDLAK
ncbi:MAG: 30S ribosomal protein S16 [Xanthomonadaceae bacterium]|nr:30S ribosomal protein S16 [Xanthomonadaceae bacterium]